MAVPYYPPLARAAKIEGLVHIKVTIDMNKVVETHVEDGPKLLADAVEMNVRTWEFGEPFQRTFIVTYRFKLTKNSEDGHITDTLILRLPTDIEVLSPPNPPLDSTKAKSD
jgi:hypothetical protein